MEFCELIHIQLVCRVDKCIFFNDHEQLSESLTNAKDVTAELLGIRVLRVGTNPVATVVINVKGNGYANAKTTSENRSTQRPARWLYAACGVGCAMEWQL